MTESMDNTKGPEGPLTTDELVREAMALPGASKLQREGSVWVDSTGQRILMVPAKSGGLSLMVHVLDARDGYAPGQYERGMDWTDIHPDPHNAGNGGIALEMLGNEAWRVRRADLGWFANTTLPTQMGAVMGSTGWEYAVQTPSAFLACCRVAVALKRWPGWSL